MQRRRKKKNNIGKWSISLILILALGFGVYYGTGKLLTPTQPPTSHKSNQPIKTSQSAGLIASSTTQAAIGSLLPVDSAGASGWLKIPSTKQLPRFTDLSNNGITIYRINNPEVLKTTTQLNQPLVRMAEVIAQYPNSLILNGSAFMMGGSNEIVGLQINNGQLIRDWNSSSTGTQYAFVLNQDGSVKIYDASTPASTIIANGGMQSYDFGTAVIRDGKILPSDGSVDWKIHSFIANDKDNNLYAILSDTNAGYDRIMSAVSSLHLQNMLLLDSGGSSQLSVNGKVIVASQDDRAVPDYIIMK